VAPGAYDEFAAGFPYEETEDQQASIDASLSDLASGRPMDRLICGDVGFGKTEVALRAAAAAALAGTQVAVAAPTTVLARQHAKTFAERFAGLGIETAQLSRLATPEEAKRAKAGIADGSVRIAIGTHALAGKGVRFKELGLLVIDEEQRFGTAAKAKLRALGKDVHVLTMTATPIPRTLQLALVGLQELSVIATPPVRRQPVRTFVIPFDPATVREALRRERRRGGQSFVVTSRIEDIEPLAERLRELVPELDLVVAHGKLPAAELDRVMVDFAAGLGDVLLSTNIIETGLDVPAANTMIVWRPDRFGLAQLHQLRGRVGRGRVRAACYLMLDPAVEIAKATAARLRNLETLDRLGAGFAISARDLDMRGAGDLLGPDQAGHVKLIGLELYQDLLARALSVARGETPPDDWRPELQLGLAGFIPEDYVPEDELRISLYRQIAASDTRAALEGLGAEIEDRFGQPPEPVRQLLALAWLRRRARTLGILRLDAGPQAAAVTFRGGFPERLDDARGAERRGDRLIMRRENATPEERLETVEALLDAVEEAIG
jgi:transcription-repair coupling factor (superfamily II helicase)